MLAKNLQIKANEVKEILGYSPGKPLESLIAEIASIDTKLLRPEDHSPEEHAEMSMEAIAQYDRAMDMLDALIPRKLVGGFLKMPRNNEREIQMYLESWRSQA